MPHYIQFYTNFKENKKRLHIKSAVQKLNIPYLIVHGSNDETVSLQEAKTINSWCTKSNLYIIENTNHTFDSKQPWENENLPNNLKKAVNQTIQFITFQ
jgi:esterase/lipase